MGWDSETGDTVGPEALGRRYYLSLMEQDAKMLLFKRGSTEFIHFLCTDLLVSAHLYFVIWNGRGAEWSSRKLPDSSHHMYAVPRANMMPFCLKNRCHPKPAHLPPGHCSQQGSIPPTDRQDEMEACNRRIHALASKDLQLLQHPSSPAASVNAHCSPVLQSTLSGAIAAP